MKTKIHIILLGIVFTSFSCSKGAEKFNCKAQTNQDCICTMDYTPVCGCDNVTYSNKCHAMCANVEIISNGECAE